jgi:hypothetical protein
MANLTAVKLKQASEDNDSKISKIRQDIESRIAKVELNF